MSDDLVKNLKVGNTSHIYARLWMYDAATHIEELDAKLAKAMKALDEIAGNKDFADDPWSIARTTLAELTGGKDE